MYIKIMKISKIYKKAYAEHYSNISIVLIVLLELDTQVFNLMSHEEQRTALSAIRRKRPTC